MASQAVSTDDFQQQNHSSQVASVEARLVRGDLLDAQTWTTRNWFLRAATLVGTAASGFQFLTTSADALAGISSYGNQIVPGLGLLWPDNTQLQLDRISDFGFRDNRVVPKGSSETVVGFFPLSRFLTKQLRDIYLKNPAAFFVPMEMLLDKKSRNMLSEPLRNAKIVKGSKEEAGNEISSALVHYKQRELSGKDTDSTGKNIMGPNDPLIVEILSHASLNNIRVVIGGAMTIDVDAVPAVISGVSFNDVSNQTAWATSTSSIPHTGTLTGQFLADGHIDVTAGTDKLTEHPLFPVTVDRGQSSDTKLVFTYITAEVVDACKPLTFTVTKKTQEGANTISSPYTVFIQPKSSPYVFTDLATCAAAKVTP